MTEHREFTIHHGSLNASVRELGATLRSLCLEATDVVDGFAIDEDSTSGRGQVLAPWPNRLAGGTYEFRGIEGVAALNDPSHHAAIHGLVRSMAFTLEDRTASRLTLSVDLVPSEAYPFSLTFRVSYELDHHQLVVTSRATNSGDGPCPFALGFHPYLTLGAPIDSLTLTAPGQSVLEVDEHLIPTGGLADTRGTPLDFTSPRPIGSLTLDTTFTTLARDRAGVAFVSLETADGERAVTLWLDAGFPFVQLFSGDTIGDTSRRRQSLAVEPMTSPPNALRSGDSLLVLAPGQSWQARFGIRPKLNAG